MKKNITKTKGYKEAIEAGLFFIRISSIIFQARKEKGISQKDLAKAVGTTQRIISVIEDADIDYNIGLNLLYRILKYFKKEMIINNKDMITGAKYFTMGIIETVGSSHSFSDDFQEGYVINHEENHNNQEIKVMDEVFSAVTI